MTTATSSTSERFSKALRNMTWDEHELAANNAYMEALLDGRMTHAGYVEMHSQHYFVYEVIEAAGEKMRDDPVAGKFVFDSLLRLPALKRDMEFLIGADWRDKIQPNEGTQAYCARMREVCFDWPAGYVAHAYTRYLGDLSGGQNIRAAIARALNLTDGRGVEFYQFPEIEDIWAFKDDYRALLNQAPWDDEEKDKVVAEALKAYRFNMDVDAIMARDFDKYFTH